MLIKTILRAGGYSKVVNKIPLKSMNLDDQKASRRRKNAPPPGLLAAVDNCARIIQRAWMAYKGNYPPLTTHL